MTWDYSGDWASPEGWLIAYGYPKPRMKEVVPIEGDDDCQKEQGAQSVQRPSASTERS